MNAPPRAYQIPVVRLSSLMRRTRLLFFLKRVTNQKAPCHPLTRGSDPRFARPVYDPWSHPLLMSALGCSSLLLTSADPKKKKKKKKKLILFLCVLLAFYFLFIFVCNIQKKKNPKKKKKEKTGYDQ
jgi:hypothetical protein